MKVPPQVLALLVCLTLAACGRTGSHDESEVVPEGGGPEVPLFVDVAAETGLNFRHVNGMTGEMYFVEMMGPGGGLFDYDNDGDLDVYLVQSHQLSAEALTNVGKPVECGPGDPRDRLFRNDLVVSEDGSTTLRFTDVTSESGIEACGYGNGITAADYDNDGWTDVYVSNWGANQMWHNNGDGTFSDVTEKTGTGDPGWGTSAAFVDIDLDGWLDLYVPNYAEYNATTEKPCYSTSSARDYCAPTAFPPQTDRLYRNLGDGTFADITAPSGVGSKQSYGLGLSVADFDGDGWPDLYVANDRKENFLWMNQRNGRFVDNGLMAGCAVNRDGMTEASMGTDTADFDQDGDADIILSHLDGESNTVYVNDGTAHFDDVTATIGLAVPSLPFTSFGIGWFDFDNDGLLDLFCANGAVIVIPEQVNENEPYPLHQKNQLFQGQSDGSFRDVSSLAGPVLQLSEVSRGMALGDVDNDGDLDILLVNSNAPARLLINQVGQNRAWIGLRLRAANINRDALGAKVEVQINDTTRRYERARVDGSYCSSRDPRVLIGLGAAPGVVKARVTWPGGRTECWAELPVNRYTTVLEGTGEACAEKDEPSGDGQSS